MRAEVNAGDRKALTERMKELRCLYDISRLFKPPLLSLERLLREIIRVIPRAWQYPARTSARLSYGGREYRSKNYSAKSPRMAQSIEVRKRPRGFVEVSYLQQVLAPPGRSSWRKRKGC